MLGQDLYSSFAANAEAITVDNTSGGKLLLAAGSRRAAVIHNAHATAPFMLGLTGVDADTGIMVVAAGETVIVPVRQALYGFRTTGTSSTAYATELK